MSYLHSQRFGAAATAASCPGAQQTPQLRDRPFVLQSVEWGYYRMAKLGCSAELSSHRPSLPSGALRETASDIHMARKVNGGEVGDPLMAEWGIR